MKAGLILLLLSTFCSAHNQSLEAQEIPRHLPATSDRLWTDPMDYGPAGAQQVATTIESTLRGFPEHLESSHRTNLTNFFLQEPPETRAIGAFIGLAVGLAAATFLTANSDSDDGPDAKVLIALPVGAALGWVVGSLLD